MYIGTVTMNPLKLREDEIGRKLAEAHASGELASAKGYGKPFEEDAAWDQTPEALRLGFKMLKNAGFAPPEVELFHQRANLRAAIDACGGDEAKVALQKQLSDLEQQIALRLEALRVQGAR
jgi:hypothetical protein